MTSRRTSALPCPKSCPWLPHPDNPAEWERCGFLDCGIERPKPKTKPEEAA